MDRQPILIQVTSTQRFQPTSTYELGVVGKYNLELFNSGDRDSNLRYKTIVITKPRQHHCEDIGNSDLLMELSTEDWEEVNDYIKYYCEWELPFNQLIDDLGTLIDRYGQYKEPSEGLVREIIRRIRAYLPKLSDSQLEYALNIGDEYNQQWPLQHLITRREYCEDIAPLVNGPDGGDSHRLAYEVAVAIYDLVNFALGEVKACGHNPCQHRDECGVRCDVYGRIYDYMLQSEDLLTDEMMDYLQKLSDNGQEPTL